MPAPLHQVSEGHVVNLGSLSGHRVASPSTSFYAASKFAVRQELRAVGSAVCECQPHPLGPPSYPPL
eukprot:728367-Prorocentrum_minimum.AAC.1